MTTTTNVRDLLALAIEKSEIRVIAELVKDYNPDYALLKKAAKLLNADSLAALLAGPKTEFNANVLERLVEASSAACFKLLMAHSSQQTMDMLKECSNTTLNTVCVEDYDIPQELAIYFIQVNYLTKFDLIINNVMQPGIELFTAASGKDLFLDRLVLNQRDALLHLIPNAAFEFIRTFLPLIPVITPEESVKVWKAISAQGVVDPKSINFIAKYATSVHSREFIPALIKTIIANDRFVDSSADTIAVVAPLDLEKLENPQPQSQPLAQTDCVSWQNKVKALNIQSPQLREICEKADITEIRYREIDAVVAIFNEVDAPWKEQIVAELRTLYKC